MNLLKNIELIKQINPLSTATSDSTSSTVVDMQNADGVMFLSIIGKSTAGSTGGQYQVKVKHSDSMASTSFTDLSTAASDAYAGFASGCTTGYLGHMIAVDLYRPTKRYVKAKLERGTVSVASGGVVAMKYGLRSGPVTQSTAYVYATDLAVSPST
jgi:hypothetical protein